MRPRLPPALLLIALLAMPAAAAVEANGASQADLESVRGIGPALSERILSARRERPFRDWRDFVRRVGTGERAAARLSEGGLTVNGTALAAPVVQTPASSSAASSAARSAASL